MEKIVFSQQEKSQIKDQFFWLLLKYHLKDFKEIKSKEAQI